MFSYFVGRFRLCRGPYTPTHGEHRHCELEGQPRGTNRSLLVCRSVSVVTARQRLLNCADGPYREGGLLVALHCHVPLPLSPCPSCLCTFSWFFYCSWVCSLCGPPLVAVTSGPPSMRPVPLLAMCYCFLLVPLGPGFRCNSLGTAMLSIPLCHKVV